MFSATLALAVLVVFWLFLAAYIIAVVRRNSGMADVIWGIAVVMSVLAVFLWWEPDGFRPVLVLMLVAVWGVRLTVHTILRNWGRPEEWRYAHLRARWGHWFALRSFMNVFLFRALVLVVVSAPALWVMTFGGPALSWLDVVGVAVWLIGYLFETIADYQLVRFLKFPSHRGTMLFGGLWKFTRHPNYFGELAMWWGLWLIALSVPGGWITVFGPIALTAWFFLKSIPTLESKFLQDADYRRYAERTNELLPWFFRQ